MTHFERFESYVPIDLDLPQNFLWASLILSLIVIGRYLLMAGVFWWIFYGLKPKATHHRQISSPLASTQSQLSEIKWSLISSFVFGLSGAGLGWLWQNDWTQIYLDYDALPLWYFPLSFLLLSFLHDTYFYFTHRLMHSQLLFQKVHSVHHRSLTPSPWASLSFHPWEAVLESIALPLIAFILPLHPLVILFYLTVMTLSAIVNHLGFEVLPESSFRQGWGRFLITGTHHSQHHRFFKYNYGLYFTFWDRLSGTEHPQYERSFQKLFAGSPQ